MRMLRMTHVGRMAAFPVALGLIGVLVSGTLNRVMIVELGMPASLVGLFFAVPFLLSPLRMWLGYRSDAFPLAGLRREPYIVLGALLAGLGVIGVAQFALGTGALTLVSALMILLAFIAYGVGKNLASNTFEALLADRFEGDARARAVTLFKIPMFAGIVGGAVVLGRLLEPFSVERLTSIVLVVAAVMLGFAMLAVIRQEPRTAAVREASRRARETSFLDAFRTLIWSDRQARLFFIFVMLTIVGTQAQDVLLEPYGALVLGMSVSETTRLTSMWGTGVILTMGLAGGWLIKRIGYRKVLRAGLLLNIVVFGGIIAAGAMGNVRMFQSFIFVLGMGTGLAAAGALAAVIDFTTLVRAGFLMGVWGVAEELGEAFGTLLGGGIVDIIRALTGGNALLAYGTVFLLEGVLLIVAMVLLSRINIGASVALIEATRADSIPSGAVPDAA